MPVSFVYAYLREESKMTGFCAVYGFTNRSNREIYKKFFGIPGTRDRRGRELPEGIERRRLWLQAINREDLKQEKLRYAAVCSDHFITGYPSKEGDVNHPDYVPNQKLGYTSGHSIGTTALSRYQRSKKRLRKESPEIEELGRDAEIPHHEDTTHAETAESQEHITSGTLVYVTQSTQTDVIEADVLLNNELYNLRQLVSQYKFSKAAFNNDDRKTLYFTGIPSFAALNSIFSRLIEPYIKITATTIIQDKFTHFIITLMRLRLNLDFTLLSHLFHVSIQTISRIFYSTLTVMYFRLKKLIMWPSREQLVNSMPQCFKDAFGKKVTVIIDCFETHMEKLKHLEAQATTWSSYKSHNTDMEAESVIRILPKTAVFYKTCSPGI